MLALKQHNHVIKHLISKPFSVLNIPLYAISWNILSSINLYFRIGLFVIIIAQVYQDGSSLTITPLRVASFFFFLNLIIGILYKYLNRLVLRSTLSMTFTYFLTYLLMELCHVLSASKQMTRCTCLPSCWSTYHPAIKRVYLSDLKAFLLTDELTDSTFSIFST